MALIRAQGTASLVGCQTSIYLYIFGQLSCDYGAVTGRGILSNGLFFFWLDTGQVKECG